MMLENTEKRKRGRPKKVKMSDDEMLEDILFKAYNFYIDETGSIKLERNGSPLTLEDTAFMIWNMEGRKTKAPLSKMAMLKTEHSALEKLRNGLAKFGIKKFDDVFDTGRNHSYATNKYGATDDPE